MYFYSNGNKSKDHFDLIGQQTYLKNMGGFHCSEKKAYIRFCVSAVLSFNKCMLLIIN